MNQAAVENQNELTLWPYEEARKLAQRVASYEPSRKVIFSGGFGPSGLPHLGTMGEVLRPSYVRHALSLLEPARGSRLIVFIDDMDGLRKVPESVPNRETVALDTGKPVSRIADPFGCCPSFSEHMIALLGKFLEPVKVDYELIRSSEMYSSGKFDDGLRLVMAKHEEIIAIVAPTLREENRAGWSPFMPLCPSCGQINSTRVTAYHPDRNTVEFSCERSFGGAHGCAFKGEQSVLGGLAKVQWKVDWALRWKVLGVDYELYGKDLIDSARLSGQIVRVLGARPPLGFAFEMYLDEEGHKVSKSVGRGVGVDQWQRYAPIEVLKYFLMLNPRRARKLFLEAIPQYVDEYLDDLRAYSSEADAVRHNSPLEFVLQEGSSRRFASDVSFGLIMNLVGALGTSNRDLIWEYLTGYDPALGADAETRALADTLMGCALNFYRDFIEPTKHRYAPASEQEREQVQALIDYLEANNNVSAEEIEKQIYELGRRFYDKPGKIFPLLYKVMLGQERGPRLGAFIRLATPARIVDVLRAAL
ncbi:MAG TPA: lysine--tRNA ligase [Candidatus Binataceae bacterium]|nr:lysine--tRNA ligase [Candidatus Binataceae bacterium]